MFVKVLLLASIVGAENQNDMDVRRSLKQQVLLMVPTCEELCKKMNSNVPEHMRDPKCSGCPKPTSAGDLGNAGSCYDKYCDPTAMEASNMCPSEDFTQCVLANSALLQVKETVPQLLDQLNSMQRAMSTYVHSIPSAATKQLRANRH